jgi:DNA-binding GntR family transcriptional regulator
MPAKARPPELRSEEISYDRLRAAIAAGELMPSQRLIESELAQNLGVGRSAIRTALARLAQENIVERMPNRGARVRRISEKEAVEILEARMALEGIAARYAALNATDADIARLRAILDDMAQRTPDGRAIAYTETNARFHREILRIADHGTAAALVETLRSRYAQYQFRVSEHPRDPDSRLEQHSAIANAIARRDPEGAEQAMREHLRDVLPGLQAEARRIGASPDMETRRI